MAKSNKRNTGVLKSNNTNGKRSVSDPKTSGEIVKRHLNNKNDKITDDDLRNLKIDSSLPTDEGQQPLEIKEDKERPKDAEKDNKTITPWDVISE